MNKKAVVVGLFVMSFSGCVSDKQMPCIDPNKAAEVVQQITTHPNFSNEYLKVKKAAEKKKRDRPVLLIDDKGIRAPGGVSTAAFAGQFVNNLVNSLVATEKFDAVEFGFLRRIEKAIEEGARSGVDVSELSQKFTRYSSPDFFLSFETANGGPTRYVNWSCASLHGDCPISISGAIEVK